jgi:hypothetical protein
MSPAPQVSSPRSTIQLFERTSTDFQASAVRLINVEDLVGGVALLLGRVELALEPVADGEPLDALSSAGWVDVDWERKDDARLGAAALWAGTGMPIATFFPAFVPKTQSRTASSAALAADAADERPLALVTAPPPRVEIFCT